VTTAAMTMERICLLFLTREPSDAPQKGDFRNVA